jgi:hypothetical protein
MYWQLKYGVKDRKHEPSSVFLPCAYCVTVFGGVLVLSTMASDLGSLLRGVPLLLRLVPWTSPLAPTGGLVSPSTSLHSGSDVSSGIGFLGLNLVFTELVFPCRQSMWYELPIAPLGFWFIFLFVQSAST